MVSGLSVNEVVVRYGPVTAVDQVSLVVEPGEIVALLGASGSGKSSLLRAVAGLEPLAGGSVAWDGHDLSGVPVHRRGFALMFQDGQLFPHLDVAGNVGFALAGRSRSGRARRVAELLALVGLEGYGQRRVDELSGGQAQRVALARSLAATPHLLLLDEPLSALDRGLREHLVGVLEESLRTTGTPALYVTHDQDEAFALADRVAVLAGGRLLQVAPPAELWRFPSDEEVAGFLGYGPFLEPGQARSLGWSGAVAADQLVGVGPGGLVESTDGALLAVRSVAVRRGGVDVEVAMPGGGSALWWRPGVFEVSDEVVSLGLDPDRCAVVPRS